MAFKAYYSHKQAQVLFLNNSPLSVYREVGTNKEITITEVIPENSTSTCKWDDAVYLGLVSHWIRNVNDLV